MVVPIDTINTNAPIRTNCPCDIHDSQRRLKKKNQINTSTLDDRSNKSLMENIVSKKKKMTRMKKGEGKRARKGRNE